MKINLINDDKLIRAKFTTRKDFIFLINIIILSFGFLCFFVFLLMQKMYLPAIVSLLLSVFFILMSMMAMFGGISPSMKALSNFKYLTLITLYDNDSILDGTNMWILETLILALVSTISYMIGLLWFKKKNLPL